LAAHLIIITACYLADYYFAEQIVLPLTINQQYGDNIISVLNTALFIGLAIKGMSEMYKYEKAEADLAARVKSDFLAQMSHEMRTPMNAIVGITALLSRSDDLAGHGEELGKITNASKHLLGVINDMLDMSKIVADKLELFEEPFSFETLVRDVVGVTAHTAEAKGQTLTLELDPALPSTLIGDKQRLAQVITNLLSNAVKFTPEGGVITVKTRLAHLEAGVLRLRVAVSDTGIGISEEQAPRLFSAFEQADNSNTRRFGGTGLGLAIAKRIVEMMHGRIWVQSVFGEGSCFTFEVELGVAEGDSEADEARGGAPDFSHIRILLAEDVEINREILAALLEPTGITIDCAENGREAAEMFKTHGESYDLIFMDIQMPELDGYEATREIRALGTERAAAIPIIAMTANVLREDIERARDAGMDGHIGKPISIEAVLDVLRERCRSKLSVPI
ncbi:MAG: response regulator, partial [Oscillospiraceae bacterium]|nr:response regulator [Oscillospiraceae bacterium]